MGSFMELKKSGDFLSLQKHLKWYLLELSQWIPETKLGGE